MLHHSASPKLSPPFQNLTYNNYFRVWFLPLLPLVHIWSHEEGPGGQPQWWGGLWHAGHLLGHGEGGGGEGGDGVPTSVGKLCKHLLNQIWSHLFLKDGVTACVPSTTINQLAILPCIEQYDGQLFDTKCELASVLFMKFQYFIFVARSPF